MADAVAPPELSERQRIAGSLDLERVTEQLADSTRAMGGLLDALRGLPEALASVSQATRTLAELADRLEQAHVQLSDAIFHLPRASEYEPLADPLREFARLSPSLLAALEKAPSLASELEAATRRVEAASERTDGSAASGPEVASASKELLAVRLDRVAHAVTIARDTIRGALGSLPQAADYAPVARQLKELATVSPSLLAWMREIPRLTTPLGESVASLDAAADALDGAFVDIELTRRDLDADSE